MYQLSLVMPVYNEEDCINDVISLWWNVLYNLNIKFLMIIINDGSTDRTKNILEGFKDFPNIMVINKKNSGHGPTILLGYHKAVAISKWVFQCDSDNEMDPRYFKYLWLNRHKFDLLLGTRLNRKQNFSRKSISLIAKIIIQFLFGKGIADVNTPYRLIRSDVLGKIITLIPISTFAPNIIVSGLIVFYGYRVFTYPVPHTHRKTGRVSIIGYNLIKSAFRSFVQVLAIRISGSKLF